MANRHIYINPSNGGTADGTTFATGYTSFTNMNTGESSNDLVTDGDVLYIWCKNGPITDNFTPAAWTTGPSNYINVIGVDATPFKWTGQLVVAAGIVDSYVRLFNCQIASLGTAEIIQNVTNLGTSSNPTVSFDLRFDRCILDDLSGSSSCTTMGYLHNKGIGRVYAVDTVFGKGDGSASINGGAATPVNCTDGATHDTSNGDYCEMYLFNCGAYILGNTTNDVWAEGVRLDQTHNSVDAYNTFSFIDNGASGNWYGGSVWELGTNGSPSWGSSRNNASGVRSTTSTTDTTAPGTGSLQSRTVSDFDNWGTTWDIASGSGLRGSGWDLNTNNPTGWSVVKQTGTFPSCPDDGTWEMWDHSSINSWGIGHLTNATTVSPPGSISVTCRGS
jgi:hypothetical protein